MTSTLTRDVQQRLAAASAVLDESDAQHRQLRGTARWAVERGDLLRVLYLAGVFVFFGLPLGLVLLGQLSTLSRARGALLTVMLTPVCGTLVTGAIVALAVGLALRSFHRVQHTVRAAASAVPPVAPGAPARCHVCGGDLAPTHDRIARCAYCAADNVVDAEVLAAVGAAHALELKDYAAAVRAEAGAVATAAGRASAFTFLAGLLSPFCCGLPTFAGLLAAWVTGAVVWFAAASTQPPTEGMVYGLVERAGEGRCVVWQNPYVTPPRWELGSSEVPYESPVIDPAGVRPVSLEALLGRVGTRRGEPAEGPIERPHWGHYLTEDSRTVDGPARVYLGRTSAPIHAVCVSP